MALSKEALPTNTKTSEALPSIGTAARFGSARFGIARFGQGDNVHDKTALPSNSLSKEALNP